MLSHAGYCVLLIFALLYQVVQFLVFLYFGVFHLFYFTFACDLFVVWGWRMCHVEDKGKDSIYLVVRNRLAVQEHWVPMIRH